MSSCRLTVNKNNDGVCQLRYNNCIIYTYYIANNNVQLLKKIHCEKFPVRFPVLISKSLLNFRLDFSNFVLAQPEATDNTCKDDLFIVTGGSPVPSICGTNTGAHSKYLPLIYFTCKQMNILVYIDMGLSSNSPIVLTVVTSGQSFERSFSVQITQLECDSLSKGNVNL